MSSHGKKMIAPIIITILFLLYLAVYGMLLIKAAMAEPQLFTRIREIRSGEEDDLINY